MKIKPSRAALIKTTSFSTIIGSVALLPLLAYAEEGVIEQIDAALNPDTAVYLAVGSSALLLCALAALAVVVYRYRHAKALRCTDLTCTQHPSKRIKTSRREIDRLRFNPDGAADYEDAAYFSSIETPEEFRVVASCKTSTRSIAAPVPPATPATAPASPVATPASPATTPASPPQRLTANYGVNYVASQPDEPKELTLEVIQDVLARLEQRDALLQASLVYRGRHYKSAGAENDAAQPAEPAIKEVYQMRHARVVASELRKIS
ncbi:MAG: hypothetical protein LBP28_00680 [Coriobacteriales bacterium]|jgi:hypothetical protein|nr:hypothetical protein [Coriobacteriales bacterium]